MLFCIVFYLSLNKSSDRFMLNLKERSMRIGYFVETPVTVTEKKMVGGQLSFLTLISGAIKCGIEPFVVISERWELVEKLESLGINCLVTPFHAIFVPLNGKYKKYHGNHEEEIENDFSRKKIIEFFKKNEVQLIHINSEFCGVIGAEVAKELGLPYIFHIREFLQADFGLRFKYEDEALQNISDSNMLIAISNAVKDHLNSIYSNTPTIVVYNGIEECNYASCGNRFSNQFIRIAIVGRVVPYKGQIDAIRAVEEIVKHKRRNVRLKIIGCTERDPSEYELELVNYVKDHNLEEYVAFVPFTSDIRKSLKDCDIGLMCSDNEAFGRVTVEYMMSNLLAIGSNSGGTPDIIVNDETGYLYEPHNYYDLADKINEAIDDIPKSIRLIENGNHRAKKLFSCNTYVDKIVAVYHSLLK